MYMDDISCRVLSKTNPSSGKPWGEVKRSSVSEPIRSATGGYRCSCLVRIEGGWRTEARRLPNGAVVVGARGRGEYFY